MAKLNKLTQRAKHSFEAFPYHVPEEKTIIYYCKYQLLQNEFDLLLIICSRYKKYERQAQFALKYVPFIMFWFEIYSS